MGFMMSRFDPMSVFCEGLTRRTHSPLPNILRHVQRVPGAEALARILTSETSILLTSAGCDLRMDGLILGLSPYLSFASLLTRALPIEPAAKRPVQKHSPLPI